MKSFLNMRNPFCLRFLPGREKLSAAVFYGCAWAYIFCITYVNTTLKTTNITLNRQLSSLAFIIIYVSMLNILLLTDYKLRDILIVFAVIGVFYISWKRGASPNAMSSCALAFSGRHVKPRQFWALTAVVFILIVLSVVWCYMQGYLVSRNYYRFSRRRLDLGFEHPNGLGSFIMTGCFYWMLLRYEKLAWFDYLLFLFLAVFCWFGPSSRAAAVILFMMVVPLPFIRKYEDRLPDSRMYQVVNYAIYPVCALFSLVLSLLYRPDSAFWQKVDFFLFTKRLSCASSFLKQYSPPFWSQKLKIVGSAKAIATGKPAAVLDNNYVRLLLEYGLVPCIVLVILIGATIYVMLKKRRCDMLLVIFLLAIYVIYENRITRIVIYCPLFLLPEVIEYFDSHVFSKEPA